MGWPQPSGSQCLVDVPASCAQRVAEGSHLQPCVLLRCAQLRRHSQPERPLVQRGGAHPRHKVFARKLLLLLLLFLHSLLLLLLFLLQSLRQRPQSLDVDSQRLHLRRGTLRHAAARGGED